MAQRPPIKIIKEVKTGTFLSKVDGYYFVIEKTGIKRQGGGEGWGIYPSTASGEIIGGKQSGAIDILDSKIKALNYLKGGFFGNSLIGHDGRYHPKKDRKPQKRYTLPAKKTTAKKTTTKRK